MEMAKENIEAEFIDGTKGQISVCKYINLFQKNKLLTEYTDKLKISGKDNSWIVDFPGLIKGYFEIIWDVNGNKDYKISDIVPESIEGYVMVKVKSFLRFGTVE
jgi:hypothetical protein